MTSRDIFAAVAFAFILVVTILGTMVAIAHASPQSNRLDLCEAEIKSRIATPSTYRRVESSDWGYDTGIVSISYDSENFYGATVRRHGTCYADEEAGTAEWFEDVLGG